MTREIADYISSLAARNYAPTTLRTYRNTLVRFYHASGCKAASDITTADLVAYRNYLAAKGVMPSSIWTIMRQIFRFFGWLAKHGELLFDPARDIELPEPRRDVARRILSQAEVRRVLYAPDVRRPDGLRDRAILELFYSTGIRLSELVGLDVRDIDLERGLLLVRYGKGAKERIVPVGEIACLWVERYLREARADLIGSYPDTGALFIGTAYGGRINRDRIWENFRRIRKRTGLAKRLTPHIMRHTFAAHMLAGGADIRYIQEILGHASLSTTKIYTRIETKDLAEVLRRYHPRSRMKVHEKSGKTGD